MRVTAKEVMAAWLDHDDSSPYHIDQKPVGVDRKQVEGPIPTNEQFENTWMPTQRAKPEEMACEQIEVVQVEIVTAEMETIPGVPASMFKAWEATHDALLDFQTDYTVKSLDKSVRSLVSFAVSLQRMGLPIDKDQMSRLKNFMQTNRPDRVDTYSPARAQDIAAKLDSALSRMHSEAVRLTGTPKHDWYEYQADQMQERGPLSQQELRTQRGPGAGFLEDLWRRKKKHELTGRRLAKFSSGLPGVSPQLFRAWKQAHDLKTAAYSGGLEDLDRLAQAVLTFGQLATSENGASSGTYAKAANFIQNHPPRDGQDYTPGEMQYYVTTLDGLISKTHEEVLRATGGDRKDWYALKDQKSVDDHEFGQVLTPEEQAEMKQMGMPVRLTPQQQQVERGPFLQEMWERTRNRERKGKRLLCAIDVKRPDTPDEANEEIKPVEKPKRKKKVKVAPAVMRTNNMAEGDASILDQPVGAWSWESYPPDESGIAGSLFSYQKSIELYEEMEDSEARLELYAFVEPLSVRKKRLLEQADRIDKGRDRSTWPDPRSGDPRAQKLRQESQNTPEQGYINDIEVFYKGELLFHRERSFTPQRALTSNEFMAGDTLQRAVTDLQQFIRANLDPKPVREFVEHALNNPGKGEQKLSKKKRKGEEAMEVMRITAADVIPLDPSRRRTKPAGAGPRKPNDPKLLLDEVGEGPGNLDLPLQGDDVDDYEALLYMFDNVGHGIEDIVKSMIVMQPRLDPDKQKEAGRLIAKMKAALRALAA